MSKDKRLNDKNWIEEQYWVNNLSIGAISKELGTYPNKVRRRLIKIAADKNLELRNKSEAQALALKSGRHKHPTEGTTRPLEVKRAISAKVSESWENISDEERERRADFSRQQWALKSDEEVADIRAKAIAAVREAAESGSKLEHFLQERLTEANYVIECHKEGLIANHKLEIDIFLPELSTVIEVDGPSHFLPIWGEDALQKTIKADTEKNGLILMEGFCIIRIKQLKRNTSVNDMWQIWDALKNCIEKIKNKYPKSRKERYIEIEIVNNYKREVQ